MAKLEQFSAIQREDLKGDKVPSWIDTILYALNTTLRSVYNAVGGGLTLQDNISNVSFPFTFKTATDYVANGTFTPITIAWPYFHRVTDVRLTKINENTSMYTVFQGTATLDWQQLGGNSVRINYISGLADDTSYAASVLVI